jgi:hypothetical protein
MPISQSGKLALFDLYTSILLTVMRNFILLSILLFQPTLDAAMDPSIRFYEINKRGQQERISVPGRNDAGCNPFLKKPRSYRFNQVGYEYCTLYTERSCPEGSEIIARWSGDGPETTKLTQGGRWILQGDSERGIKVGSWNCKLPAE